MADLRLEIVTPERSVVSDTVDAVTVPGREGELGILPGHAALISSLKSGILTYTKGSDARKMVVSGGFVEVSNDRVSVLADTAEFADEIDTAAARAEMDSIDRTMGNLSGEELEDARDRFERAEARLQLAAGR
ncbi:MAG: F0F1 ATP synthase subunit epsilon [Acidobacteriota bacterium]|nr:F0F1 ATP synthase subunit epsilon [Acidobacteriota bacterium]